MGGSTGSWRDLMGGRVRSPPPAKAGIAGQAPARVYDPDTGRFLQTDPVGQAGGLNIYAYTGADPVNFTDPSGLRRICSYQPNSRRILCANVQNTTEEKARNIRRGIHSGAIGRSNNYGRGSSGGGGKSGGGGAGGNSGAGRNGNGKVQVCSATFAAPIVSGARASFGGDPLTVSLTSGHPFFRIEVEINTRGVYGSLAGDAGGGILDTQDTDSDPSILWRYFQIRNSSVNILGPDGSMETLGGGDTGIYTYWYNVVQGREASVVVQANGNEGSVGVTVRGVMDNRRCAN